MRLKLDGRIGHEMKLDGRIGHEIETRRWNETLGENLV